MMRMYCIASYIVQGRQNEDKKEEQGRYFVEFKRHDGQHKQHWFQHGCVILATHV